MWRANSPGEFSTGFNTPSAPWRGTSVIWSYGEGWALNHRGDILGGARVLMQGEGCSQSLLSETNWQEPSSRIETIIRRETSKIKPHVLPFHLRKAVNLHK